MTAVERSLEVRRQRTERLTRVGPGTPAGEYLRRFWYPVAALTELDEWPVKKIRLLGEDLALYRTEDGTLGLLADRCPHRGASLSCGMTDGSLLRCAYHGWAYDTTGQCVETPAEPATSTLRSRIKTAGYPVQEMGGMLWAYLGPHPVPLLPRYEHVVRDDLEKAVTISDLPCNWLQCAENSVDPIHLEFLHMKFLNWARKHKGLSENVRMRKHERFDFELFEYGILKKRMWVGDTEDSEEWKIGHPLIFPGTLFVPINATWVEWQFRVPVDDERTIIYWYDAKVPEDGKPTSNAVPLAQNPWGTPDGKFFPEVINAQDMMMWISQGPITDHSREHLGESDRGVALYRKTLLEELDKVARGEDPRGVVRDPAQNTPYIKLPIERTLGYTLTGATASATYVFPERDVVAPPV
jgi:5,5'-dehydrodivanillate O-demethylase